MKKSLLILLLTVLCGNAWSQIDLAIDYKSFNLPGEKPYLEFYLSINGNTIQYNPTEGGLYQANIEMTYIISNGDSIVAFKKFQLLSPQYSENDTLMDIIDLKRMPVDNGQYDFEFLAVDLNSKEQASNRVPLEPIAFSSDQLECSQVQLANGVLAVESPTSFSKNGVEIIPNIGNFYNAQHKQFAFYLEVYNSDQSLGEGEAFLIDYSIVNEASGNVMNNLRGYQRLSAAAVIPVVQIFNIENLPSGNYNLSIALKNKQNEVLYERKLKFQRSNPNLQDLSTVDASNSFVSNMTNMDELKEYIRCTQPISSYSEIQYAKNQMNYSNLEFMQQYFLNFWNTRNPSDPEQAWLEYKREVDLADREFGYGGVKGYQTERGRIFLQYGKPNARQKVPYEPNTYPYSIWQYYKLNGQTNRKFVFYSPSMEMLGYKLLHSNVPGEIQNPNWEAELENKSVNRGNTYELNEGEVINSRAKDLYDNPR